MRDLGADIGHGYELRQIDSPLHVNHDLVAVKFAPAAAYRHVRLQCGMAELELAPNSFQKAQLRKEPSHVCMLAVTGNRNVSVVNVILLAMAARNVTYSQPLPYLT